MTESYTIDALLDDYERYVNPSMARVMRFMGVEGYEVEARGAEVRTSDGSTYLDLGGYGVFFHGHSHPKVVAAVQRQAETLALSTRLLPNRPVVELARRLAESLPGDLQYTFFCNSGAEAVEGALKLARMYTGKPGVIATQGGFHGKTLGALSATGKDMYRQPFLPLLPGFRHVPFGDAAAVEQAFDETVGAVIVEPIQGEGGVIVPPDDYLARLRAICDARGAVLIVDEVQTGVGRTGPMWAIERSGVVPDIIASGKSLGGGIVPIGAFTARAEVFRPFDENPLIHTSTFGGNPLACAAGVAALDAIAEEGLLERGQEIGTAFMSGLREIQKEFPGALREVRGRGLLIGLEFADEGAGGAFIAALLHRKVVVVHSLNHPRVIRVMPPAIVTRDQIDYALESMRAAASEAAALAG
ncbi:MAG: aspartate aminotransferase family protein [Clostridia bacterium]|nr:aspartate aminotransferase family protein [Clostridia bacterium]